MLLCYHQGCSFKTKIKKNFNPFTGCHQHVCIFIYIIITTRKNKSHFESHSCKELWDIIISVPFLNKTAQCLLKEIGKH